MAKTIKKYSRIALIIGLMIVLVGSYMFIPEIKAGTLDERQVKLSDSRIGQAGVDYIFQADESAATALKCIKVEFCQAATGSCTAPTTMDWGNVDTGNSSDWDTGNFTYASWAILSSTTNSITATTTEGAGEALGNDGVFVFGNITNDSATSTYYAKIYTYSDQNCSAEVDTGTVAFAVFSGVTVTATVAESLNVTVNASTCDSLMTAGTDKPSTTTTVPFGTIDATTFYNSCQRIDIDTNASDGYTATVYKTQALTSGGDIIADGDCDGSCATSTDEEWSNTANAGFGYCMKDHTLSAAQVADADWATYNCGAGTEHYKVISNTSGDAETIMSSGSATTTNKAYIGYRLNVDSAQGAGTYSTTIIYVVTPKY